MSLDLTGKGGIGVLLMVLGTVALVPSVLPTAAATFTYLLLPAAVVLTVGTYLVGTDVTGRVV